MRRSARHLLSSWASEINGLHLSVSEAYEQLVRKKVLQHHPQQQQLAEACTTLSQLIQSSEHPPGGGRHDAVVGWLPSWRRHAGTSSPGVVERSSSMLRQWIQQLRCVGRGGSLSTLAEAESIGCANKRGLYIWGDVGVGKTLMLDLFDLCATPLPKRRAHLHSFITDVQDRLIASEAELRQIRRAALTAAEKRAVAGLRPMHLVVSQVLRESPILCFDEFQTFDVAHAALLASFFSTAFSQGVYFITTSNRAPLDLCTASSSFSAFAASIHQYCQVVEVRGVADHRMQGAEDGPHDRVFVFPATRDATEQLIRRVERGFRGREEVVWERGRVIPHRGRELIIPYSCGGVAVYDFVEMCGASPGLSPLDYQLLAANFHTILITNVPQVGLANCDLSHRFIVLVDELYQHHVKLLLTVQVPWAHVMDGTSFWGGMDSLGGGGGSYYCEGDDDRSSCATTVSSFHNEEERMSYARVRSRLHEMGSALYLLRDHREFVVEDYNFNALIQ